MIMLAWKVVDKEMRLGSSISIWKHQNMNKDSLCCLLVEILNRYKKEPSWDVEELFPVYAPIGQVVTSKNGIFCFQTRDAAQVFIGGSGKYLSPSRSFTGPKFLHAIKVDGINPVEDVRFIGGSNNVFNLFERPACRREVKYIGYRDIIAFKQVTVLE
jgi:hypothetical protein